MIAGAFVFGFFLYRLVIGRFSHGRDENILLITLGLSIVIDNAALLFFGGDTQTIDVPYAGAFVEIGAAFLPLPKIISFAASLLICAVLGLYMAQERHRQGDPRRGQGAPGRAAGRHRRRQHLRRLLRHRHRLPGRGGVPA